MLVCVLAMMVFIVPLTACANGDGDDAGDFDNPSGTIVVGGWPAGDEAFMAIEAMFNEQFPDVTVEYQFLATADFEQSLIMALAAGTGAVDVAMIEGGMIGELRESPALEDLLQLPYDAARLESAFVPFRWQMAQSMDGRQTGIPWDIGPATMFYRRDIFQEVGLPYEPEDVEVLLSTWDGFLQAAEAVHIPGQRWIMPDAAQLYYWHFMNRDFFNERLEPQLDRPGVAQALDTAAIVRNNGWDMQADMWSTEANAAFANGSLVTVVAGAWYGGFLKSWVSPDNPGNWGVVRLPGGIPDSNWGGSFLAIPSQSENKAAAWAYIEFAMANPDAQNAMFEAVDYFPALITAWEDTALYNYEDPWFAGQRTRALWVDIARSIMPYHTTMIDGPVEGIMVDTVNSGLNAGLSTSEIMSNVYTNIMEQLREAREINIEALRDAGLWHD